MSLLSRLYNKPIAFVIVLIAVTLFGIFVEHYRVISLPLLLLLLAMVTPKAKKSSLIFHALFLFLIAACFIQITGLAFWILGVKFTWPILIILLFLSISFLYFIRYKKGLINTPGVLITKDDAVSMIITIGSMALIIAATLHGGTATQQIIRYFTSGFDNVAHVSLTLSTYDEQGYIYGPPSEVSDKLVYADFSAYPKGWHLVNSIMMHGVSEHLDVQASPRNVFVLYFAILMSWYGLVLFFASRLMIWLVRLHQRKKEARSSAVVYVVVVATFAFLQIALLLSALNSGFGNYFALMTFLIAIVQCGVWLHEDNGISRSQFILYGLILSTGISLTWFLAAPIGFLFVLLSFMYTFQKPKEFKEWLFSHWALIGASLALLAVSCIQVFLQFKYSATPNNINATGGIWDLNYLLLSILVAGAVLWVAKTMGKKDGFAVPLLISIICFGIMSGLIYFYQYFTAGVINYYAIKMSSLLVLILIVFCGAIIAINLDKITSKMGRFLTIVAVACFVFIVPLATGLNMESLRIIGKGEKKLSPHSSSVIVNLLNEKKIYASNIFIMKELDYEEDIITTHFMNMLSRKYPDCMQSFIWHKITSDKESAMNDVATCATANINTQYYIVSSSVSFDKLTSRFENNPNIEVILSN